MARCVYYAACTLDGYIATRDDDIEWLTGYRPAAAYDGEPMKGSYDEFFSRIGTLVMGSVTYEWVLEHVEDWPYPESPTWVLSSRDLQRPPGDEADVRVVEAAITDIWEELAAAAGDGAVWIVGGGGVASDFAEAGLLDEVIVTVVPVVLGEGKPLFDRPLPGGPMRLTGTHAWDTGMVELRYEIDR